MVKLARGLNGNLVTFFGLHLQYFLTVGGWMVAKSSKDLALGIVMSSQQGEFSEIVAVDTHPETKEQIVLVICNWGGLVLERT